jgi:hypothetical protein
LGRSRPGIVANIDRQKDRQACISGLKRILELAEINEQSCRTVEHVFENKQYGQPLDEAFAINFIDALKFNNRNFDLHHLFDWIADLACRNPIAALTICEQVVSKLFTLESSHQVWRTESLISALSVILREADESDDESLIQRAVKLQDKYLQMNISGIEDFFDQASRF